MARRRISMVLVAALALAVGVTVARGEPADAGPLACPPIPITTSIKLTSDCAGSELLVIGNNITVNLNGHTVFCGAGGKGINIINSTGVTARNGTIDMGGGCTGANIAGTGGNNRLVGINFKASTQTTIGVLIFGADGTTGNRIVGNKMTGGAQGILVAGDGNRVTGNRVTGNILGVHVTDGNANRIAGNVVTHNGTGITLTDGSSANTVIGNLALGNGLDLSDTSPGCDANLWFFNFFSSADQPCIH